MDQMTDLQMTPAMKIVDPTEVGQAYRAKLKEKNIGRAVLALLDTDQTPTPAQARGFQRLQAKILKTPIGQAYDKALRRAMMTPEELAFWERFEQTAEYKALEAAKNPRAFGVAKQAADKKRALLMDTTDEGRALAMVRAGPQHVAFYTMFKRTKEYQDVAKKRVILEKMLHENSITPEVYFQQRKAWSEWAAYNKKHDELWALVSRMQRAHDEVASSAIGRAFQTRVSGTEIGKTVSAKRDAGQSLTQQETHDYDAQAQELIQSISAGNNFQEAEKNAMMLAIAPKAVVDAFKKRCEDSKVVVDIPGEAGQSEEYQQQVAEVRKQSIILGNSNEGRALLVAATIAQGNDLFQRALETKEYKALQPQQEAYETQLHAGALSFEELKKRLYELDEYKAFARTPEGQAIIGHEFEQRVVCQLMKTPIGQALEKGGNLAQTKIDFDIAKCIGIWLACAPKEVAEKFRERCQKSKIQFTELRRGDQAQSLVWKYSDEGRALELATMPEEAKQYQKQLMATDQYKALLPEQQKLEAQLHAGTLPFDEFKQQLHALPEYKAFASTPEGQAMIGPANPATTTQEELEQRVVSQLMKTPIGQALDKEPCDNLAQRRTDFEVARCIAIRLARAPEEVAHKFLQRCQESEIKFTEPQREDRHYRNQLTQVHRKNLVWEYSDEGRALELATVPEEAKQHQERLMATEQYKALLSEQQKLETQLHAGTLHFDAFKQQLHALPEYKAFARANPAAMEKLLTQIVDKMMESPIGQAFEQVGRNKNTPEGGVFDQAMQIAIMVGNATHDVAEAFEKRCRESQVVVDVPKITGHSEQWQQQLAEVCKQDIVFYRSKEGRALQLDRATPEDRSLLEKALAIDEYKALQPYLEILEDLLHAGRLTVEQFDEQLHNLPEYIAWANTPQGRAVTGELPNYGDWLLVCAIGTAVLLGARYGVRRWRKKSWAT